MPLPAMFASRAFKLTPVVVLMHAGLLWALATSLSHRASASPPVEAVVAELVAPEPAPKPPRITAPQRPKAPPQPAPQPRPRPMPQPRSEPERAPDEPRAAVASPLDAHHATAVAAPAGAQTRTPAPSARPAAPAMAAVPEDSASAGPRSVAIGEMRCRTPEPAYPLASRRLGEQGTVRVRLLIDESGLPQQVELAASSGFERLDRVALEASRATRCVPYTADGRAIRVTAVRPFVFRLD